MADKIVILEDANGNNIYPISRGLATNSVDTNAIQNGAVTSAKIDWTTIDYGESEVAVGKLGAKTVYRGYFTGTITPGMPTGGYKDLKSGVDDLIGYSGYIDTSGGNQFTLPWTNMDSSTGTVTEIFRAYRRNDGSVRLQAFASDNTSRNYKVWLYYTKSS